MSNLYIYNFGDEKYIVDDSGERWTDAIYGPDPTVICESCYDEVTEAIENEHGTIMCWDCQDVTVIDISKHRGNLLDFGEDCNHSESGCKLIDEAVNKGEYNAKVL